MTTAILRGAILAVLVASPLPGIADEGSFERVEAVDFARDDFVFPDDIRGDGLHLIFLAMGTDQDNGQYQGEAIIAWHEALVAADVIPSGATPWHFPVMDSLPFFLKGLVRRGIAKSYKGKLPPQQGAVLYVDDLREFAASAGLQADGVPTLVLYDPAVGVLRVFKGEVSPEGVAAVKAAISGAPDLAAARLKG